MDWIIEHIDSAKEESGAVRGRSDKDWIAEWESFVNMLDTWGCNVGYAATKNVKEWMIENGMSEVEVIYTDNQEDAEYIIENDKLNLK
ncbi:MAG: hypothetical protein M0D57_14375 [Sphingobacteriales bacterium JAD_PAG50586_3]|nr:MAG: hypothetical protein M0D57_14375 [Sphingobacteriales bacterium JAD_PAG50586_3]